MRKITEIRTWSKNGKDFRVYVTFEGSKEQGVYYKDGNAWNAKGKIENMSLKELKDALSICTIKLGGQQAWVTVYENEIVKETVKKTKKVSSSNWDMSALNYDRKKGLAGNTADYLNM